LTVFRTLKRRPALPRASYDLRMVTLVIVVPWTKGVWELRIDRGPGFRVYYAVAVKRVILLCEGGDKRTQKADIKRAQARWSDWKSRMKHGRGS
jgi:putative addiction module killer protein